jgi:PAS domain S-box-containing protein
LVSELSKHVPEDKLQLIKKEAGWENDGSDVKLGNGNAQGSDDESEERGAGSEEKQIEFRNDGFSLVKNLLVSIFRSCKAFSPILTREYHLDAQKAQHSFVISDPLLADNPIIYASKGFYDLTGYTADEIVGRNCRFLQGAKTDPKQVTKIRDAISKGTDISVCLLNYKKCGTPFWNQFFVAALFNKENQVVNYVGVQCEVRRDSF